MGSFFGPANLRGIASGRAASSRQLAEGYIQGEEVYQHMVVDYIVWSHVLAFVGAYVGFTTTMYMKQVNDSRWYWIMLVQAGLSLGGCTIWSMHFVGMQALRLWGGSQSGSEGEIVIKFEPVLTVGSALVAWFMATCSLHVALPRKSTITEVVNAGGVTKVRSVKPPRTDLLGYVKLLPLRRVGVSSVMLAAAVCAMHYMGMLSQSGNFTMSYNPFIVCVSVLVAVVVSFAGLCIFFFVFDSIVYRVFSAVIVSVAVNGMHYCGMASATYFAHSSWHHGPFGTGSGSRSWSLGGEAIMVAVLLLDLVLMAATGYYVEVLETVRRREGEAFEKELRHKSYLRGCDELVRRSRVMRYPMCLLRYETFVRLGKLVVHETLRDSNKLIFVNNVAAALKRSKKRFIVFFSHQWLSRKIPDPKNRQFQDMVSAMKSLSAHYHVKLEDMCVWVDYSCMPQEGMDQQQLAIDSLVTYATVCSAFVIIAPQVLHTETLTPCNFMTYAKRCWCRLEVFCSILASLRATEQGNNARTTTGAEEEEEEEVISVVRDPMNPAFANSRPVLLMPQTTAARVHSQHRVFLVVDDQLHRLNFFTSEGKLRQEYEELLLIFDGELQCCSCGHVGADGREISCDKMKVVETLSGCYGSMLVDLRRNQRHNTPDADDLARRGLAEHVVKLRHRIFPQELFDSRIDAMHERVGGCSARRIEEGAEGDDASSTDEMILDLPEEPENSSVSSQEVEELHTEGVEAEAHFWE